MNNGKSFLKGIAAGVAVTALTGSIVLAGWQHGIFDTKWIRQTLSNGTKSTIVDAGTEQKIGVIKGLIDDYFLENADEEALREGLYAGMVRALGDPYSVYYSAEELAAAQDRNRGIYYGIGAGVSMDTEKGLPRISKVYPDTPAEEAGVREGDLIYKVADTEVSDMGLSQVVDLIKGPEGTKIHITFFREETNGYVELDVERRKLETQTVESKMLQDGIGYIHIAEFDDVTVNQFSDALAACTEEGMKGLVLDLRGNPGGNLTTVCDIARKILPEGLIVYTEDKNGKKTEYTCDGTNELHIPMTVLVDGNSASAAEILAGAVKDYEKGTLVGTTTFGKGIVQRIITLSDDSAVKLTVSNYFTPKGNNIHKVGIAPDVEIPFDGKIYTEQGIDNQLEKAVEILKEKMEQ